MLPLGRAVDLQAIFPVPFSAGGKADTPAEKGTGNIAGKTAPE
jgi:hypothetical protein